MSALFPGLEGRVVDVFLVVCRIGAFLALAPGFSAAQLPGRVRLFVALAAAGAIAPVVTGVGSLAITANVADLARCAVRELMAGLALGAMARCLFWGIESAIGACAASVGFSNPLGLEIEPEQTLTPLASFVTLAAIALVFASDAHFEMLRGLELSYRVAPLGAGLPERLELGQLAAGLGAGFQAALRLCSPLVVFGLFVNFGVNLAGRIAPSIQVFPIAAPLAAAGGLALLYASAHSVFGGIAPTFDSGLWAD